MKKTWISVKVGLLDTKHQAKMGPTIWLYLHLVNDVNWDTGIVYGYTHKDYAKKVGRPRETIRKWMRILTDEGYVKPDKQDHHLNIIIHNWTNPREYSGSTYHPKGVSTEEHPPSSRVSTDGQGGVHQTIGVMDTLPSSSNNNINGNNRSHVTFLKAFDIKKFENADQMMLLHDLEEKHGLKKLEEVIAWAVQKDWNSLDHLLNSISKSIRNWKGGTPIKGKKKEERPAWANNL